jgi:hypothetical protein
MVPANMGELWDVHCAHWFIVSPQLIGNFYVVCSRRGSAAWPGRVQIGFGFFHQNGDDTSTETEAAICQGIPSLRPSDLLKTFAQSPGFCIN